MYKGKKVLAFIPARGGSKRIKNKNIRKLLGKPLFQYSVDIAKKSKYIDDILVSSDSIDILDIAHKLGCIKNNVRPEEFSSDTARVIDAICYEIGANKLDYDSLVLLQPTSPIRTIELLDGAIEEYFKTETSLITVKNTRDNPVFIRKVVNNKLQKIIDNSSDIRSQDFEKFYTIIGNIYINNFHDLNKNTVLNENKYPFQIADMYSVDIDTEDDWKLAEQILNGKNY